MRTGSSNICLTLTFLTILLFSLFNNAEGAAGPERDEVPSLSADAAVLMDALTGQVLFEKNGTQRRPPASTTKIMTALLALQGGELDREVTVSAAAASVGEASLDLRAGERLLLGELVYGALLQSGNDACVAIAEHIAGTETNFVLLMNQKARLLGACDTSFKNTNGLPAPGHYSTARDLAVLARYALGNPVFKDIVGTREKIIGSREKRYLHNTNHLLWSYPGADGVKTGTTDEAGGCLVASATREGRRLISVVLHSENRWIDSIRLLDHGFESFEYVRLLGKGETYDRIAVKEGLTGEVRAVALAELGAVISRGRREDLETRVELKRDLVAPVSRGEKVGRVELLLNGKMVGSTDLVAERDVKRMSTLLILRKKYIF